MEIPSHIHINTVQVVNRPHETQQLPSPLRIDHVTMELCVPAPTLRVIRDDAVLVQLFPDIQVAVADVNKLSVRKTNVLFVSHPLRRCTTFV